MDNSEEDDQKRLAANMIKLLIKQDVEREWALYRKTRNGAHVWAAYKQFRETMTRTAKFTGESGNTLPSAFLEYFDECAAALDCAKTPQEIKRALQLSKAPNQSLDAERSGGPQGYTRAASERRQRDILEFLVFEYRRLGGKGKKVDRENLYERVAGEFDTTRQVVKNLAHDWGLTEYLKK